MCESIQAESLLTVGPYKIDISEPISVAHKGNIEGLPQINRYKCTKANYKFTAKCYDRDKIGAAAKKKSYQKWNAQVRNITEQFSSVDSPNIISTIEVIKTSQSYWFIQDYDAEQVSTMADYLKTRTSQVDQSQQTQLFSLAQLH